MTNSSLFIESSFANLGDGNVTQVGSICETHGTD